MNYKNGICKGCNTIQSLVNVKYCLCFKCNRERLNMNKPVKVYKQPKMQYIKRISSKQLHINKDYYNTLKEFDMVTEKFCTGCGKWEPVIKLSHSHIISRADCANYNRMDLYSDPRNITYHCLSFGDNHVGCATKWENSERVTLLDYEKNIAFVKQEIPELYKIKYL